MFDHLENVKEIERRINECRLSGGGKLDLSHLYIAKVPAELSQLQDIHELVHLDLGNMALKVVPQCLRSMKLETLKLNNNQLKKIPAWLGAMPTLKVLDVSGNTKLKSLPDLGNLHSMEILDISDLPLKKIPNFIRRYSNLRELLIGGIYRETAIGFLSDYFIKSLAIPEWLGELSKLEYLYMGRSVSKIPKSIDNLSNLKKIDIWESKIKSLPESFGKLSSLVELSIHASNIHHLPQSFGNLTNLLKLEL
jgi:Leucine-rich repeat (LRR) protein